MSRTSKIIFSPLSLSRSSFGRILHVRNILLNLRFLISHRQSPEFQIRPCPPRQWFPPAPRQKAYCQVPWESLSENWWKWSWTTSRLMTPYTVRSTHPSSALSYILKASLSSFNNVSSSSSLRNQEARWQNSLNSSNPEPEQYQIATGKLSDILPSTSISLITSLSPW